MTAIRNWSAPTVVLLLALWVTAVWLLWGTSVPDGLGIPHLDVHDYFTQAQLDRADRYERFHRISWVLATLVLLGVLAVYAARGVAFVRESAAGRIGTGMLLAMIGFGLVWLAELPFEIAGNWWDRRHGISKVGYFEVVFGGWLALGVEFLFLSLSIVIVMGLAGVFGDRWWIPGSLVFVGLATLFVFVSPFTVTDAHSVDDPRLAADIRRLAHIEGVQDVEVRVEDVDRYTSAANAYATGLGPSRKVFLFNTLLDGRFGEDEVRVVVAHEFGHQKQNHLWKSVGWYALFAIPGAWIIARTTRRRGGMQRPEAVPLSLLVLVILALVAQPVENIISRHIEAEADWEALQATGDPAAATDLFRHFSLTSLGDPNPPVWSYVMLETHPTLIQRIEMARAWKARYPNVKPRFGATP